MSSITSGFFGGSNKFCFSLAFFFVRCFGGFMFVSLSSLFCESLELITEWVLLLSTRLSDFCATVCLVNGRSRTLMLWVLGISIISVGLLVSGNCNGTL